MSKSCSGKINKTRYDDPGKPMKPTSFTVKTLGGNLPEKQSTIENRSFRSSTKLLSLDSIINPRRWTHSRNLLPLQNLWTLQYMNTTLWCMNPSTWLIPLHESQYVTHSPTWWKRMLASKFFTSSTMNIKKHLVTKPKGTKT